MKFSTFFVRTMEVTYLEGVIPSRKYALRGILVH